MSRKIFLSFLGTNNYVACNYYAETDHSNRADGVQYVQEALIQMYCKDFGGDDRCCFFLTDKARQMNWEDNGQWNKKTGAYDLPNDGLYSRLKKLNVEAQIRDVRIPEGFSSEEIWEIFEIVFGCIEDGDEVYFDITHAFRSLPLLGMALLNYAKALRKIQVNAIFYGAFEKLGPSPEVAKMPMEARNAPILDMLSVSELQDWTTAAFEFVHYGKVSNLRQLTTKRIVPILAETKGKDEIAHRLRMIIKTTAEMYKAVATNRGAEIYESIGFNELKSNIQFFSEQKSFIKPLNAIIKILADKVAPFKNNDPLHWLKSARWCVGHGMYQQAITQLQEGVLTWLCLQLQPVNGFFDWNNEAPRNLLSSVFAIIEKNIDQSKWGKEAREYAWLTSTLVRHPFFKEIARLFSSLRDLRNDVNHGGYKENRSKADKIIQRCEELVKGLETINWSEPLSVKFSPLLNLSNHPVAVWQEKQLAEAKRMFGDVVDMPFPNIAPNMSEAGLEKLVEKHFQNIIDQSPAAVHIMGEMTFTCRMVARLKAAGITCLASTTERVVRQEGEKTISEFRFRRFRQY